MINLVETTMEGIQQLSKMNRMQARMQGMTESILATNRRLRFEAPLLWVCDDGIRPSHFYLFSDMLLWGTLKEKNKRRETNLTERAIAEREKLAAERGASEPGDEPLLYRGKMPIQVRPIAVCV